MQCIHLLLYIDLLTFSACRAGGGGAGRGKPSNPSPPPTTTVAAAVMATVSAGDAAPGGGAAPGNQVLVQFMWQPLTQMSYPKVTLLTSLGVCMCKFSGTSLIRTQLE